MAPNGKAPEEAQEEDENEQQQETRRSRRRNKKPKLQMGEKSGLTEEDRRQLRTEQREVAKELHEGPTEEMDPDEWVEGVREKNNELFHNVRFAREAVLDAENVAGIAQKFSNKVESMVSVPRYNPHDLIKSLKRKLTGGQAAGSTFFDWGTLGVEVGICFSSLPSRVNFLVGPLENGRVPQKKQRVSRKRKSDVKEEALEEQKPEEIAKKAKKTADQLSQAERDLKKMTNVLKKRAKEAHDENRAKYDEIKASQPELRQEAKKELVEKGEEVELVPFLVNPKSFTQTVENLFNFSFLIKKGTASIKMRKPQPLGESQNGGCLGLDSTGCYVAPVDGELYDAHDGPARQSVISFTMQDWSRLCEAYELQTCDVPHRKGSKQQKADFDGEQRQRRRQSSSQEEDAEEEEQEEQGEEAEEEEEQAVEEGEEDEE